MSFWALNEGELTNTEKFEIENGLMEPIPAKTQVLAFAEEVKWDEYDDVEYINVKWSVLQPSEYKNRKIFQKIRVNEEDPKKRDKAIRMLAAIDTNAKGKLMASGKRPSDADLVKLTNKPMVLMLQVWEMEDKQTGDIKKGNWVSAISPKNEGTSDRVVPVEHKKAELPEIDINEDDMPF